MDAAVRADLEAPASRPAAPRPVANRAPAGVVAGACLAYAAIYAPLAWLRYATYHSRTFDLAFYVRIVWGLGHGNLWVPLSGAYYPGLHLEPALIVPALLGRVLPIAPMLVVMQALAVATAPIPLFRLARRRFAGQADGDLRAALVSLAVLLYPTVTVATTFDFHPGTMAITPLLFALEALDRGAGGRRALVGWLAVALSLREDVALAIMMIGLLVLFRPEASGDARGRDRIVGGALLVAGALWFFGYTLGVQPRFLPAHGSYDAHFGGFGHSVGSILASALSHPGELGRYLLSEDRPTYPWVLLWPVALLALGAPRLLVPALPLIGVNLLSSFPRVRTIEAHYATVIVPFVLAAAAVGAARVTDMAGRRLAPRVAAWLPVGALLACVTLAHVQHGDSPLARGWDGSRFRRDTYASAASKIVAGVPAGAAVRAPRRLVAHLAERPEVSSLEDSPPSRYDVLIVEEAGTGLPVRRR